MTYSIFILGPFVREGVSPSPSPLLHRATPNIRPVLKNSDIVDGRKQSTPPMSPRLGKLIIRATRSPDRASSPDYVRTPTTVVGPTSPTNPNRQVRGAYVNVQGDEGKTSPSGTSTDDRDCTGRTGRLEAAHTSAIAPRSKDESRVPGGPILSSTSALASSNKLSEPDRSRNFGGSQKHRPKRKFDHDENHPPELNGDAIETSVCEITLSKDKLISINPVNSRLDFEKSGLYSKNLRVAGNTPKLGRKLLVSDLDSPSFCKKILDHPDNNQNTVGENKLTSKVTVINADKCDSDNKNVITDCTESSDTNQNNQIAKKSDQIRNDRIDRKVKRSESYRMANSPIMFIKKLSSSVEKSSKICRTPSEELQEELLKEKINYPETVSSPEPQLDNNVTIDVNLTNSIQSIPTSPRPRATDLEPVRALNYSGNDTEIW